MFDVDVTNKRLSLWRTTQQVIPDLERMVEACRELGLHALWPDFQAALKQARGVDFGVEQTLIQQGVIAGGSLTEKAREAGIVDPREREVVFDTIVGVQSEPFWSDITPTPPGWLAAQRHRQQVHSNDRKE